VEKLSKRFDLMSIPETALLLTEVKAASHFVAAKWAFDCAKRVQSVFDQTHPEDPNIRLAFESLHGWLLGTVVMMVCRKRAQEAHRSAREAKNEAATYAARSAASACATAHAKLHAFAAAQYAQKTLGEQGLIIQELAWQRSRLQTLVCDEIVTIQEDSR
jgi:lysylphosphatidylglycerol synthetase-like protein (DUF2156 family)